MTASNARDELLARYAADLDAARQVAQRRVEGRVKTWSGRLGSEARAREKVDAQGPACSDTRVIHVLRKYWLECDAVNRRDPGNAVDPRNFLLDSLRPGSPELAAFLEPLPYWPMGKDEKGNWI